MASPLRDLQVVDDGFIAKMLTNPNWSAAFPFLRRHAALFKASASCGTCKKGSRPEKVSLSEVKQAIAHLPSDLQARFKELAMVKQVRVVYRTSGNLIKTVTF